MPVHFFSDTLIPLKYHGSRCLCAGSATGKRLYCCQPSSALRLTTDEIQRILKIGMFCFALWNVLCVIPVLLAGSCEFSGRIWNKSGFATCYHVKLLLIFRKYRKRYFLHNKKSTGASHDVIRSDAFLLYRLTRIPAGRPGTQSRCGDVIPHSLSPSLRPQSYQFPVILFHRLLKKLPIFSKKP